MTIQINSKKLAHSIGLALAAIGLLNGNSEFKQMLPHWTALTMNILISLMPWFTMVGITVNQPNA